MDFCSYKENKSLYGHLKGRNPKCNAATKEAESSFSSIFKNLNGKNDTDIKEANSISLQDSLTESSVVLSGKPSVTITPINTQSETPSLEIVPVKDKVSTKGHLNSQLICYDTTTNNMNETKTSLSKKSKNTLTLEILGNNWLSDEAIQFYYELLSDSVINETKGSDKINIGLMNSIISQAIKCLNDFQHCLSNMDLQNKTHVLTPVNDSPVVGKPGGSGSHWSLLLYVTENKEFLYFDSLKLQNYEHALKISSAWRSLIGENKVCNITPVKVPQQFTGLTVIFI